MSEPALADHFDTLDQQRRAGEFGIWIFLATEVLFFGALFVGYAYNRTLHPKAFEHAARETLVWAGTVNTALLLASSFTVALAVRAAEAGARRRLATLIRATLALGLGFLAIKGYEYHHDVSKHLIPGHPEFPLHPEATQIFFSFYWAMTGVHAIHMVVGVGLWTAALILLRRGRAWPRRTARIEAFGLYWHFVDLVWIFLWPMLYLVGRAQ